ncbi:CapA family protein [Candidatus Microgenomates bacterium]|nr:CapA family protein [Candidatus Microgenomates bacterium]
MIGRLSKRWQKFIVIGAGALLVGIGAGWLWREQLWPPTPRLSVAVDPTYKVEYETRIRGFFSQHQIELVITDEVNAADIEIGPDRRAISADIALPTVSRPVQLAGNQIIVAEPQAQAVSTNQATLARQDARTLVDDLAALLSQDVGETWTLTALGDVILGRQVYAKMLQYGYTAPFTAMAKTVNDTDLTLANLECTIADGLSYPTLGMSFTAPAAALKGLKLAGIDGVNLANNHSLNGGETGYLAMLKLLKEQSIAYFGGGADATQAYAAQTFTVKGTKVSLLGYSSIAGTVAAGAKVPGHAYFSLPPWGDQVESEIARMEADVKAAKSQSDLVMVYVHWGAEYTHTASAEMRQVAHRLVDAGADVILGTHPHWVQGIEWYKDRLITYSLGNFVFDQEWSIETKQGVVLKATFEGSRLVSAKFVPYQIEDYHQPRLASQATSKQILNDIYTHSWWPGSSR